MKRVKRIVIDQKKKNEPSVRFAEQQGKSDRYISTPNGPLTKLLEVEGKEAVEVEILRMVLDSEIVFNGNDESLRIYKKAWNEWRDFYFLSDKSSEVLKEILKNIRTEIDENESCCIKLKTGLYSGLYSVNGKLYMYSTEDIKGTEPEYFPNKISATKTMSLLNQCDNFSSQSPTIILKSDPNITTGIEEIASYCKDSGVEVVYEGFLKESFGTRITECKKYQLSNPSYKLVANLSSNRYTLYFKGTKVLNCGKQSEVMSFIEEYCKRFPVNIGKTTKFAQLLREIKNNEEEVI